MKTELTEELVCSDCGGAFSLNTFEGEGADVEEGLLECACGKRYPIAKGIPRILPDALFEFPDLAGKCGTEETRDPDSGFGRSWKRTQRSFGRQWTTYEVQNAEEDAHLFRTKTGFVPDSLQGQRVLDAGCGGGRYACVAGRSGAEVLAVDISQAVEKTAQLCADLPNVHVIQANLMELPVRQETFDRIYSIGVLHHTPDTRAAFEALLPFLRPGGQISIWLYRRWTPYREAMNTFWRSMATRLPHPVVHAIAVLGSPWGGIKGWAYRSRFRLLARLLWQTEKFLPGFSNHPDWRQRVCDTFDWLTPQYQWHHTDEEVTEWFREAGLTDVRNLSEDANYYIEGQGEGVNFSARKPSR